MAPSNALYEKLGAFYLGREYDLADGDVCDDLVLYDSKDLCTHAFLVGMTGSGKTGLGVSLLEEAAIDGVPALVIDPKGDMANLLLNFPELAGEQFEPWVSADEAARAGQSVADFAAAQAARWKQGLADWGQDGERIARLRDAAEFTVYTPGSEAGVPLSIVSSFAAPPQEVLEDADLLRDRVTSTATSILSLLGIEADPVQSREHILLTIILDHAWRQRLDLNLGAIIRQIQSPPVTQVGVMDLDAFFPEKDRFELAMTVNNLLAAPSFAAWMQGDPLDVDRLLYTSSGKPRISIFSIAHLSDAERMFFVSLLLNQTLGWMRTRPGTSSLRALLYIDEIFGYMPPVAEPATKKPLLTLLKQARAFGLGVVLATQNPADLDYKGLSNIGTWFLGRLQTERDKQRILDGLEGASSESGEAFDRNTISEVLSNLGKRVFLMHNVHEDGPVIFHTRWALSYLSGPMTRDQIKRLPKPQVASEETAPPQVASPQMDATPESGPPVLPPGVDAYFLPAQRLAAGDVVYQPYLLALAHVHFHDGRRKLSADEEVTFLLDVHDDRPSLDWSDAEELAVLHDDVQSEAQEDGHFAALPKSLTEKKQLASWKKQLDDYLYRTRRYELFKSPTFKEYSSPGETERNFRIRLGEQAHELRDEALEKLRRKYATKIRTLEDRILRAEQKVEIEQQQATGSQLQTAISWGATVLSAVMGRKRFGAGTIGKATTAARGWERSRQQVSDVARAQERLQRYESQLRDLEQELEQEEELVRDKYDPLQEDLETIQIKPRRGDIDIRVLGIGWVPIEASAEGDPVRLLR